MNSVLKLFLAEEANPYVRNLIVDAVKTHGTKPGELQKRFEFNRFEVTLDFEGNSVLIEDVIDPADSGELRIQLDEFVQYLT